MEGCGLYWSYFTRSALPQKNTINFNIRYPKSMHIKNNKKQQVILIINIDGANDYWQYYNLVYFLFFQYRQQILAYIMATTSSNQSTIITEENINEELVEDVGDERRLVQRYFGPMEEGSLRGAIFALLASAMGTGVFNLPERTNQIGVVPFALFIFLGGLFSMIGMVFMVRLILQNKYKSYGEMSEAAYGTPLKRFSQICIIIYPWGITICFQVIFAAFACQLLDQAGINLYQDTDKRQLNQTGNLFRIGINLGCLMLTSIFALKKNITMLQKIAIVGVVSVIFNITTVIVVSLTGFTRPDDKLHYDSIFKMNAANVNWFTFDGWESISLLAQGMASILFCYVNHQMLFPLSMSLRRPNSRRFTKIINRVHAIEFILYATIGITAYLLLLQHTDKHRIAPVVLSSIPILIVTIGKVIMLAALFFAVPLNMFPARQSLFDAMNIERSNRNHIIVTMTLMCSSTAIAIGFQKVNSYFGLLGGTAGVMMAGGIPGLCYFKLRGTLTALDKVLLVLCFLITILAAAGAVLSVVDAPKS